MRRIYVPLYESISWRNIDDRDRKLVDLVKSAKWELGETHEIYYIINHYMYRFEKVDMEHSRLKSSVLDKELLTDVMQLILGKKVEDVEIIQKNKEIKLLKIGDNKISMSQVKRGLLKKMHKRKMKTISDVVKFISWLMPSKVDDLMTKKQLSDFIKKKEKDDKKENKKEDSKEKFVSPIEDDFRISSVFGYRKHPVLKKTRFHSGIDLAAKKGTEVLSIYQGKVIDVRDEDKGAYGKYVEILHPYEWKGKKISSKYAHLSQVDVKKGDSVDRGQVIGEVGSTGRSTGPHLHFETRVKGDNDDLIGDQDKTELHTFDPDKVWKSSYGYYVRDPLAFDYEGPLGKPQA